MRNFTKSKPTEFGFYWYKDNLNTAPEVVRVEFPSERFPWKGEVWRFEYDDSRDLENFNGYWLGPIQPETEG